MKRSGGGFGSCSPELPGLILWGDTIIEIWRPPHEKISVLKKNGGLKQIGAEKVISELKQLLEK